MHSLKHHFPIHKLLKALAVGLALAAFPAALSAQTGNAPQDTRADCRAQADAKGLRSGAERQAFMRQCVHGSPAPKPMASSNAAPPAVSQPPAAGAPKVAAPPPDRTTLCNQQAADKGLRGPERREFMRQCMRGTN